MASRVGRWDEKLLQHAEWLNGLKRKRQNVYVSHNNARKNTNNIAIPVNIWMVLERSRDAMNVKMEQREYCFILLL